MCSYCLPYSDIYQRLVHRHAMLPVVRSYQPRSDAQEPEKPKVEEIEDRHVFPSCTKLHQAALSCTRLHRTAPSTPCVPRSVPRVYPGVYPVHFASQDGHLTEGGRGG